MAPGRLAPVLAVLIAAAPAHADSPRLADARRAVEAVDYDAARRLLVEALRDGDNSPAAMREIYRLSARAAVVLDQRDLAEQYYRRWLAIDPDAALPADTAPKLRQPFIAAQAYIAAHGRLTARARRTAGGEIDVELLADPLAMAHAAVALASTGGPAPGPSTGPTRSPAVAPGGATASASGPVAFGGDRRARLPGGARIAIVDDRGNHLIELDPEPAALPAAPAVPPSAPPAVPVARASPASPPSSPTPESPPRTRRWVAWAIPTGVFALGAAGFGVAAIASYGRAHEITMDSGGFFLSDAQDNARRGEIFAWITAGAAAAAIGCAIPTAIYLYRDLRGGSVAAAPIVGPGQIGVALGGRF